MTIEFPDLTPEQIAEGQQPVPDSWIFVDALFLGDRLLRLYVFQDDSGNWVPANKWIALTDPTIIPDAKAKGA